MKTQMSLAAVSLALALASACAQDKPQQNASDTEPATQDPGSETEVHDEGQDPNFDPSKSPSDVDKNKDPGNGEAATVDERQVKFAFDAAKLTGEAGEAVVITIDHKTVTSNNQCAAAVEHSPISESGYDAEATTLVIEASSRAAVSVESQDTIADDFEFAQTLTYSCGKSPLTVILKNMDAGHQIELSLTVHTAETTVYAEAKPFVALNKTDGEKTITLDYPGVE